MAVNYNNTPFRIEDNKLFFRPGGHGALIDKLNALQSDIIYIKNIDNVSQNNRELILNHKKLFKENEYNEGKRLINECDNFSCTKSVMDILVNEDALKSGIALDGAKLVTNKNVKYKTEIKLMTLFIVI